MGLALSRVSSLLLIALAGAPLACATSSDDATRGSRDDLTSRTAHARKLHFAGYVYTDEGASDETILEAVRAQTKSAFGALRGASIATNSRELRDVDPTTFLKETVAVVDRTKVDAAPTHVLKVSYTYSDDAVVPKTMDTRSAVPLGLLGKSYGKQSARIVAECTAGDDEAHEFVDSVWYVFNPMLDACKAAMGTEQAKIDQDRQGLAVGEVPPSEIDRLYVPMTATLDPSAADAGEKYPEYDRLFSGGVEPGKLVAGMLFGIQADWAAGEQHDTFEDPVYASWYQSLREVFTARAGFALVSVEGVPSPYEYTVGDTKVTFGSFDEMLRFELDRDYPPGITGENRDALRRVIADTLVRRWITFEVPVRVTMNGETKPLTIKLQTYFGADLDSIPYKRAISTSDLFVYDGHSYIGYGPLDPTEFTAADFPPSYQVLNINGCVSYNYYEKGYIPLKAGGTKNLDLVTNGLESYIYESGEASGRYIGAFIDGRMNSYAAILEAAEFTYDGYDWGRDALRVVDGELDNVYSPQTTPITIE